MPLNLTDEQYMRMALNLARRGLGRTAPNPSVGCVIVKNGQIIGCGTTASGGRPHAEVIALAMAGKAAKGATAYVTLEPCCHYGKTPPCTDALIAAGIKKVVMAAEDNYTLVAGRGRDALKAAKIEVVEGVLEKEARALNEGFISLVQRQRPLVTLKLATSVDGKIATHSGESRWITGESARAYGHYLRATHDAVLVGSGTAVKDDPLLTCRLPGLEKRNPLRVVADNRLQLSPSSRLAQTAKEVPVWVLSTQVLTPALQKMGVELTPVKGGENGTLDAEDMMFQLAERGITRLLVEGGARIAASLLKARVVDRLVVMQAGVAIGADGMGAVEALGLSKLAQAPRFTLEKTRRFGNDTILTYRAN